MTFSGAENDKSPGNCLRGLWILFLRLEDQLNVGRSIPHWITVLGFRPSRGRTVSFTKSRPASRIELRDIFGWLLRAT